MFTTRNGSSTKLEIYVDTSWANYIETRRSTTGIIAYLENHIEDWSSKRQTIVTHSTAETEYIAADSAARMVIWLRSLLHNLGMTQEALLLCTKIMLTSFYYEEAKENS